MNNKYILTIQSDNGEIKREYKTLTDISNDLNVEIHIIRKINKLTENMVANIKPHTTHKELYEKIKIYNIKKTFNI